MEDDGVIQWPIFVSIGTPEKLDDFLGMNPCVPRGGILVDDYNHMLYKELGFGRFDEIADFGWLDVAKAGKLLRFTDLGAGNLLKYTTKGLSLAPVKGRVDWRNLPEGGLRNGGTLIVKGDDVVYQWIDKIPSDVPNVNDVLDRARKAAMENIIRKY